ncbi:MAG: pentapeptide repeat-containing protein, partial [Ruegeria sp.]
MRRRVFINRPKSPDTSAIDRINELSKIARTNWFGLLAYLAFAGVTLLGVQDADFFIESRRTTLPLIGVEIPTRDFFIFGPILGSALYVYLHLYLLKLWEALAEAPPRPKGKALSLQVTPWLINDLGLALRRDNAFHRRPMDWLSHLVTFLLVFAVGPIVIGYFWVRYWPAHELGFSIFNALLFTLTTMTMLSSLFTAITRLRYGRTYQGGWWHLMALLPTLIILIPAAALTVAKTDGPEQLGVFRVATEKAYAVTYQILTEIKILPKPIDPEDGTDPYALTISSADLREVEIVSLPADWLGYEVHRRKFRVEWCAQQGLDPKTCGSSKNDGVLKIHNVSAREHWCDNNGYETNPRCTDFFSDLEIQFSKAWKAERQAKLRSLEDWSPRNSDLRAANMAFGSFAGADLREAQMKAVDLRRAQMEGADLSEAQMQGANLRGAQMQGAYLGLAQMQGAELRAAQMQGANLSVAQMQGANLRGAQMQGADLCAAQMKGAELRAAQMQGANLRVAQMQGADLFKARMQGADLSEAHMQGAELRAAQMQGANLSGAHMQAADLRWARMQGVDLFKAQMQGA